ncbi:MAG: hypothetical protein HYV97_01495 [Bdellovibrio sp.]|nr:hypothetical protein [Bdellovibrio sp.]
MKIALVLIIIAINAEATVFNLKGDRIEFQNSEFMLSELVKAFAGVNKLNVVFDSDYKDGQVTTVGPKWIHKDSLELYLSAMLSQNGFGMRVLPGTNTLSVFNGHDVRYLLLDSYTDVAKIPDTYEYIQFMYELKHISGDELARNLRSFMGRYGKIIDHANSILIVDAGKNVKRIMQIVQELDTAAYLQSAEEIKELNEKNKKTIGKKKGLLQVLSDNNIIFLLLFSILGGMIGFGVRGYAMKRIEGGW